MAVAKRSGLSVRPRHALVCLALGTSLAAVGGCKHNRYGAMRPRYIGPATVVPVEPCPSPGLAAPAFEDEAISPPSLLAPADPAVRPGASEEPHLEPSTVAPEAPAAEPDDRNGPVLETPRTSRRSARPEAPRTRQATLRTRLSKYVNDPHDLFQPPKADRSWKYIVLHHSAQPEGDYAQIDREHRSRLGSAGCGYHFVIGNGTSSPDGQIEVAQRWSDQRGGAHCRDAKSPAVNDYGIGICLVGDLDQEGPTPKQIEAAQALVAYLQTRYNIPAPNVDVHARLAHNPTACPGKHFPADSILGAGRVARTGHFAAK
jgi:N-acetyl-anhydromuramyl-L-alanine amidase AmpD